VSLPSHTVITEKDRPVAYALRRLALEAEQLSGRLMDASDVVAELEKRELLGRAMVERQRQMLNDAAQHPTGDTEP